jgi:hypothetical protein
MSVFIFIYLVFNVIIVLSLPILSGCKGGFLTVQMSFALIFRSIKHQGIAAFNPNPATYQVFRNVKDFGAKVSSLSP